MNIGRLIYIPVEPDRNTSIRSITATHLFHIHLLSPGILPSPVPVLVRHVPADKTHSDARAAVEVVPSPQSVEEAVPTPLQTASGVVVAALHFHRARKSSVLDGASWAVERAAKRLGSLVAEEGGLGSPCQNRGVVVVVVVVMDEGEDEVQENAYLMVEVEVGVDVPSYSVGVE